MITLTIKISADYEDDISSFLRESYYLEEFVQIAISKRKKTHQKSYSYNEICNDGTVKINVDVEEKNEKV